MTPDPLEGDARFSLAIPGEPLRCEIVVGAGSLGRLPALVRAHAPAHRYAVVADENVAPLYGTRVVEALVAAGSIAELTTFPAGEASKTPTEWARLVEALAGRGLGRDGCVVAVGGGVTGDLAGFVAATYGRGVPLVHVPTSLLAMVDSSIGGKTGLDLDRGKNLVGAFHQPRLVVSDPDVLATLPEPELRAGAAEAVKHGVIADAAYFHWLAASASACLARDAEVLKEVVAGSVRVKTRFVLEDVREAGARAMLNAGHTMAHAIEQVTRYGVTHGHAVAIGLVAEARIGEAAGLTEAGTAGIVAAALQAFGLPVSLPDEVDPGSLIEAARLDKKAREGAVRYALVRRVGEPLRSPDGGWAHPVPDEVAVRALGVA